MYRPPPGVAETAVNYFCWGRYPLTALLISSYDSAKRSYYYVKRSYDSAK